MEKLGEKLLRPILFGMSDIPSPTLPMGDQNRHLFCQMAVDPAGVDRGCGEGRMGEDEGPDGARPNIKLRSQHLNAITSS